MRAALATLLSTALATQSVACSTDAMLVFDGSASMAEVSLETGDVSRLVEAQEAIRIAMPLVEPYRRIGLLTYGPGPENSCEGIRLRFTPVENAAAPVIEAIDTLNPAGLTPLAVAVETAAEAMDYRSRPAIIVLVTDGNETCGGTPCATSRRMVNVAADLTIHVIGFRATRDFFAWDNPEQQEFGGDTVAKCFADRTGGLFLSTETVDELVEALQATLGCLVVGRLEE
ncbi:vWA domain-containing protein [Jannaschia seohaensis]|uniref:Ca-activated chloride channel family protein n=1 Tax=Jannaschia seohaensis TaxID=475081 RepID=A0A2Y9AQR3_9RHOB|nr:VWA domain-containing protein [Jannaschia seohaensis]PWJ18255.1 Ca-activated chloride channel family protein [Jannaschia seohaensis]SSA46780.1 Ca-activated chloride channel family protein [Jannaschia seohaensis]